MIIAATALAEWNPKARLVNARTLRLRPSVRPVVDPKLECGEDPVAVLAYGALELDERRQPRSLRR